MSKTEQMLTQLYTRQECASRVKSSDRWYSGAFQGNLAGGSNDVGGPADIQIFLIEPRVIGPNRGENEFN